MGLGLGAGLGMMLPGMVAAYWNGPPAAAQSYLRIDKILEVDPADLLANYENSPIADDE